MENYYCAIDTRLNIFKPIEQKQVFKLVRKPNILILTTDKTVTLPTWEKYILVLDKTKFIQYLIDNECMVANF